jgi:hypothetical protein
LKLLSATDESLVGWVLDDLVELDFVDELDDVEELDEVEVLEDVELVEPVVPVVVSGLIGEKVSCPTPNPMTDASMPVPEIVTGSLVFRAVITS